MISYGIMQGRLTPSRERGIQFFPFDNWQKEFFTAETLGLQEIEWIFDYERYDENPIWTLSGREALRKIIHRTGVIVYSVCFDYFMRRPFYKYQGNEQKERYQENLEMAYNVLDGLAEIGAQLLEVPMVDSSSVKTLKERDSAVEYIGRLAEYGAKKNLKIGLETDFAPGVFTSFLEEVHADNVFANFDSGNSSGIGYLPEEEIPALGDRICNVHIKDRVYHGTTVALGTGSADFDGVFKNLKKVGYHNSFILQAARGRDGLEEETVRKQLDFVKGYIDKYRLQEEDAL